MRNTEQNAPPVVPAAAVGGIYAAARRCAGAIGRVALATVLAVAATSASASEVIVGGQAMYSNQDIVDNAVNSAVHKTLVAAVKQADLVDTLKGRGPFTVFAPTDDAFENLPAGTLDKLLKPQSKQTLRRILSYHVVPGKLTAEAILGAIEKGEGRAVLETVAGATLIARQNGPRNVILIDERGNTANISTYDVIQSNGVIHVIDTVVLPK